MIANLTMYDRPETRLAWQAYWSMVVSELEAAGSQIDCPARLSWDAADETMWCATDLLVSQTCSLPFRTRLYDKVTLMGAFDFGLPGAPAGEYNSVLVMRADDPRNVWENLTLAYNAPDSQSGWAAPLEFASQCATKFGAGVETGAHAASVVAVIEERADIAAVDAQTWRLLTRYDGIAPPLREVTRTAPTPGLPLIAGPQVDAALVWQAFCAAFDRLSMTNRELLDLHGLIDLPSERYLALRRPPSPAYYFGETHFP